MKIISRVRSAVRGFATDRHKAVHTAASVVRSTAMLVSGTLGAGRPLVVGVCVAANLAADYTALRLTR